MTVGIQCPLLRRPALLAERLAATPWDSPGDKARAGDAILAFIARGMPRSGLTGALYGRLSNMFGFIACYDLHGFWGTHFAATSARIGFLEQIVSWPCWGRPTQTWCDVEREIQARIVACGLIAAYRAQDKQETLRAEREQLARLLEKHGHPAGLALPPPTAVASPLPRQLSLC